MFKLHRLVLVLVTLELLSYIHWRYLYISDEISVVEHIYVWTLWKSFDRPWPPIDQSTLTVISIIVTFYTEAKFKHNTSRFCFK